MSLDKGKVRNLILSGNLYKVLFFISFPIFIIYVIQALYDLVDMFYVSKLGAIPLAALSLANPINFFIMAFATGMATGSISLLARCVGEGNFHRFSKYAGQLIILNFIISLFITICILMFIGDLLDFVGAKGDLKELIMLYFYVEAFGIPVIFLSISITSILNAQGETIFLMLIVLFALIINFILDPILIFFFNMGLAGAALSTLFSKLLIVLFYFFVTYGLNHSLKIYFQDFVLDVKIIKEIIRLALPSVLGFMMISLSYFVLNSIVIKISPKFLAAYGLSNMILSFLYLPGFGIGVGISAIVGQNLGAKQINRVGEAFKKGFIVALLILITLSSIAMIFRQFIISLFTKDLEVISYANKYLFLVIIGSVGFGLQQIFYGGLNGVGRTKVSMMIYCIRLWLIHLPLVIIFQYFKIFENSMGYAFIIGNYSVIAVLVILTCTRVGQNLLFKLHFPFF